MSFSTRILLGLAGGIAAGIFFGEAIAAAEGSRRRLRPAAADGGVPYVFLSIAASLGSLT